jgi:hypothetical protein
MKTDCNITCFPVLILLSRPAAGKSEVIHFLRNTPLPSRLEKFHVGKLIIIDDFPMLWTWFEEDHLLEKMDHPRLYTDKDGYFLHRYFWDLLIERINLEYLKYQRDFNGHDHTVIIEFSRGKEHGGYRRAFSHLSDDILKKSVILYVNVSWEESLRKNRLRFNPKKPDSILEHSLPDEKMRTLYYETDWQELTRDNPDFLLIKQVKVPYVVFENEDDVTICPGPELSQRLRDATQILYKLKYDVK